MSRPTMIDVDNEAKVSLKTVSRVVNRHGYVRAETAARVEEAIAKIGYRRNEIARQMRPGQVSTDIGLLTGDLRNPFFGTIAATVIEEARARGYGVMISSVDENPANEHHAIDGLLRRRVAGLLLVSGSEHLDFLRDEVEMGLPVVFLDRPSAGVPADEVLLANVDGAREAVGHLVAAGFRRIATIVAPGRFATGGRLQGYRQAITEAFGGVDDSLVSLLDRGSADLAEAAANTLMAMDDPPDAYFTTTGFVTTGLLRALGDRSGIGIVGFDDLPLAEMLAVPVTVMSSEPRTLAMLAVDTLFRRIGGEDSPPQSFLVKPRLIVRG